MFGALVVHPKGENVYIEFVSSKLVSLSYKTKIVLIENKRKLVYYYFKRNLFLFLLNK